MMEIPTGFHFSQSSLQDYVDCGKRFYLRHLRRVVWPAVEAEPFLEHERELQAGNIFHRMVQQHLNGVPGTRLEALAASLTQLPALQSWWDHYINQAPLRCHSRTAALTLDAIGKEKLLPELSLSIPFGEYRLTAKYDLVLILEAGEVLIFDWKTSHHRPNRQRLGSRLQTRVYPLVMAGAGNQINQGRLFPPEKIEMIYWFAAHPAQPEIFPYSQHSCQEDEAYLLGLIREIENHTESMFAPTGDGRRCRYCAYRSLCDRGEGAGSIFEFSSEVDMEDPGSEADSAERFDFEQVGEIEF
jgi:hypothetical protein